jgi:hypothetical protein
MAGAGRGEDLVLTMVFAVVAFGMKKMQAVWTFRRTVWQRYESSTRRGTDRTGIAAEEDAHKTHIMHKKYTHNAQKTHT